MNEAFVPATQEIEHIPTRRLLEGFARLHPLVVVADPRGRIVWTSDALGAVSSAAEGRIVEHDSRLLPPLSDPEAFARLGAHPSRHESFADVRIELEGRGGETRHVDVSAFGVPGEAGEPLIVAIVRPVQERERADAEPGRGGPFASIIEASPDAVVALDRSNFITCANPAAERLLTEEPGALIGKPIAHFLPYAARLASAAGNGESSGQEMELHLRGGRSAWVSVSLRRLRDGNGAALFLRDVTAQRAAREKLENKNAELESTLHGVSHDLRSPLVSLLGFSRLLRDDFADALDETGRRYLDRVEQAGRSMEALLHHLLELSRIDRPGGHRTLVDPREILLQLHAELKPRLDALGARLSLPESPPLLFCDRTLIYQVLSNLIGNALDHSRPEDQPDVRVSIGEEADHHHVVVEDDGPGIAASQHGRVFDVFYTGGPRPDGSRSTGIGLAIVKKIAEAHDGRVWVESEPGRGAAFHLILPRDPRSPGDTAPGPIA